MKHSLTLATFASIASFAFTTPSFAATPVDASLLGKYCLDDVCLFTPLDAVPASLYDQSAGARSEYDRMKALPPSCDGIGGGGTLGVVSASKKEVAIGFDARPEPQGKHVRVAMVRAIVPGAFAKEQLVTVFREQMKKMAFPPKSYLDMGSWLRAEKVDKGMQILMTASAGSDQLQVQIESTDRALSKDDFARQPECRTSTPKF